MSVSLDDIWSEPLVNPPSPPPAGSGTGVVNEDGDDDDEDVFRPKKRRRSTLFLGESDDEDGRAGMGSPSHTNQARPDIDSLFNDLEDPEAPRQSKSSKPFDLAALRRDAQARAEQEAPQSSYAQYAVQSSSPPRDGFGAGDKDGAFGSRTADEAGATKKRQVPKLNEDRLLDKNGLPALVQVCKDFKPKGKGHELADLNRLFSLYQFWAHKMYPKTQFSDTVNRVEKLCHSKRMHSALLGWRDQINGTINGKKFSQDEDIDMNSDNGENSDDERRRER
ncbi:Swi3-domain-containing protein, partial [Fomitiporia mediterranea MF3/22]|uniref:Swi3-domain-containing protein n=1 Tax=Fomitiporia mediterranea (strain MF3/22) TaxID=694068 RepID=UPI0004407811